MRQSSPMCKARASPSPPNSRHTLVSGGAALHTRVRTRTARCTPARASPGRRRQVETSAMTWLLGYVKVTDCTFTAAVLCIFFNPLFWNVVARWEHRTRALSRVFGSPYTACYCLGLIILLLNFVRSHWSAATTATIWADLRDAALQCSPLTSVEVRHLSTWEDLGPGISLLLFPFKNGVNGPVLPHRGVVRINTLKIALWAADSGALSHCF
ncbi:phosphatidylethanolamine N-methyltransferase isoform X3 [Alligator sinensis]|uniref:Phosphatidylethanolamine N-methyltransferase isoform X3 n=1 Tax=Alligator sinensis TaxID=38654 RepID=A0A3Q0GQA9_ALLSI|nr:phosphatidylethanolamine N-methyltransferase isoform X3 [Alligator sinensis]